MLIEYFVHPLHRFAYQIPVPPRCHKCAEREWKLRVPCNTCGVPCCSKCLDEAGECKSDCGRSCCARKMGFFDVKDDDWTIYEDAIEAAFQNDEVYLIPDEHMEFDPVEVKDGAPARRIPFGVKHKMTAAYPAIEELERLYVAAGGSQKDLDRERDRWQKEVDRVKAKSDLVEFPPGTQ